LQFPNAHRITNYKLCSPLNWDSSSSACGRTPGYNIDRETNDNCRENPPLGSRLVRTLDSHLRSCLSQVHTAVSGGVNFSDFGRWWFTKLQLHSRGTAAWTCRKPEGRKAAGQREVWRPQPTRYPCCSRRGALHIDLPQWTDNSALWLNGARGR
jgi:hypothetical protein